ncbi:hypothetical protein HK100_012391 [Physocladia obscura]|uniref:Enoyl reductase (ER) domain-containing protein n=1 Tax=Physocladia obscura TaxID=109957 RepID=A0AAD5XD91_9FUNG|nr:hypothetical protein HK100_012391 [Physocladia obscura]
MDILQRQGFYGPPAGESTILGVEFSGTVVSVGSDVFSEWQIGERVFGLVYGGAYSEYVVIEAAMAARLPNKISYAIGAALPEVWLTAFQALFWNCSLVTGEDVLIHAGASAVGIAAIQLAKNAGARRIIVTVSSQEKIEFCTSLGATHAINYKSDDFKTKVAEFTEDRGVDVIVDFIGANYWDSNLASLAFDGRMVMLGFLGGPVVNSSNLGPILRKRLTVRGSALRSRSLAYQIKLKQQVEQEVFKPIFEGKTDMRAIIDREFSWKEISEAHRYLESDKSKGKIVITVD